MKLALVSNYCPDRRTLSEYGYHLAHGLKASGPDHEVIVLSGKYSERSGDGELRIWSHGSINIPFQILRALEVNQPDGVLFNTNFTAWGNNLANFSGLMAPWLVKKAGFKTITLLHYIPQNIDAKKTGYRLTPFHCVAIELACWALAKSNVVCFTLQKNLDYFQQHYRPQKAVLVPLGLQGKPSWSPPSTKENRVLTFGKWGNAKNPEPIIRSFLRKEIEGCLTVAGGSTYERKSFVEKLQRKNTSEKVVFTGYVLEEDIPILFHRANLVVLQYEETPGVSAVLLQTCQYGRVPVIKRLPGFVQMVEDLHLTAYFYDTEEELGELIQALLSDKAFLVEAGRHNYRQVKHLSMDRITEIYWKLLEECHG